MWVETVLSPVMLLAGWLGQGLARREVACAQTLLQFGVAFRIGFGVVIGKGDLGLLGAFIRGLPV